MHDALCQTKSKLLSISIGLKGMFPFDVKYRVKYFHIILNLTNFEGKQDYIMIRRVLLLVFINSYR